MRLETERLILRDIKEGDQESIRKNINNLEISKYLLVVPHPYSKKDADWWVGHCLKNQNKKTRESYEFGIAIKPSDNIVGGIGLSKVNIEQSRATLGYWLGKDFWRKGYMFEAAQKIIDFGFNKLGLRRIDVEAFTENEASNNLIKKLRFNYEGTLRDACVCKATKKIHSGHFYGLLKKDWKKYKKRLK